MWRCVLPTAPELQITGGDGLSQDATQLRGISLALMSFQIVEVITEAGGLYEIGQGQQISSAERLTVVVGDGHQLVR